MGHTLSKHLPEISDERLKELLEYNWRNVNHNVEQFYNESTWPMLADIILYHPNQIVRHEASYNAGDLNLVEFIPILIKAVKYDPSIVAKHEAAEALGFMTGEKAKEGLELLKKIVNKEPGFDELVYHDDVIKTAEASVQLLEKNLNIIN